MIAVITNCTFIFLARVTDVSMATIRTLMIVRGKRYYAALIGFFEVIIYILALNQVVNSLDKPLNLIIYALGFAAGSFTGSFLEEKMAIGNVSAQLIINQNGLEIIDVLREEGFGVTVVDGEGRDGLKKVLFISLKRKDLPKFKNIINDLEEEKFLVIMDAKKTMGGYYRQRRKAK